MTKMNELLDKLLSQTEETATLEFKREIRLSSDTEKREFAKDVSALANSTGGYVLFGKEDKTEGGRILGIRPETFDADQMQQIIASRCYPPVKFNAELIKKDSKWFVLLEIPESDLKPHEIIKTRDVWIRRGGITDKATQREREQISHKREESKTAGSKVPIKEQLEMEGIPEKPESWPIKVMISVGRRYMQRVYGRLDVSLFKEGILLAVLSFLCFTPLAFWFYQISSTKVTPASWFSVLSVLFTVVGVILFGVLGIVRSLECSNCKRHFGIRRTQHIRVQDRENYRTEEHVKREVTYRNTYECEFCDYKETRFETETETIDIV